MVFAFSGRNAVIIKRALYSWPVECEGMLSCYFTVLLRDHYNTALFFVLGRVGVSSCVIRILSHVDSMLCG